MDGLTVVSGSFILVIGIAVLAFVYRSDRKARLKREAQHVLSANAVVIGERTEISGNENYTNTYYYVTFNIEGFGRAEFNVSGNASGLLIEGDRGTLRYFTDPLRFVSFDLAERSQQLQQ